MYTKRIFTPRQVIVWTRQEIVILLIISTIPVLLYDVLDQRWLHLPWLPVALVGTAVAFILGFQNNAAYDRVWEARKIWGGIVNSSRAFGFAVGDLITNEFAKEPASEAELSEIRKRLILRHGGWMCALRYNLRSSRPWEELHRERTNVEWQELIHIHEHENPLKEQLPPYLPEAERQSVCGTGNPAVQILANQSHDLRDLHMRGLIDDFRHMEFQGLMRSLVEEQGKAERIKNFPYPRQYATLNSTLLWLFLVLIPFGLVREFAEIRTGLDSDMGWIREAFIWASVPFSTIVMWVFHTMERIGRVTENPFEGSVNDVPITTIARGIEIDLMQMIGADPSEVPEPLPVHHDTQT